MRLLVTGGAGFIGSNFIKYWLEAHPGDDVVNFDKLTYAGNLENLKDIADKPARPAGGSARYRFVQGDIADVNATGEVMNGIDTVVNFAAESHVDRSIMEPAAFVQTNVVGTQVLLDAALKHRVKRFHHISTDEVFGAIALDNGEKFSEISPYNPSSPYAASKAASDHLVRAYHKTYGLPITITNCSNNYGPYQFPEKFIALAITNIIEGNKIPLYTPGNQVRDWLYVEDHCRAIDLVLQKGKIGETYAVGGMTKEVSNVEVAKMILDLAGKDENAIEFVKDRPAHDVKYAIDWKKIHQELGWLPQISFDGGLRKTIEWYKKNEQWWKELKKKNKEYYEKQYGKA
ncbi:MAG: dTDP-glucose 4,6-dehydratase [bacterium]|nr:dTDP-glucose 4,6-dehydratase [bacterium]